MTKKKVSPEMEQPITKAQAMRDALAVNPDVMPKELADQLTAQGFNVSAKEVSQAKYLLKAAGAKKGRKKPASKSDKATKAAPATTATSDDLVSVAALQKAKKLVRELGGVKEAKEALLALSQLLD
jgi:hypothetical protein